MTVKEAIDYCKEMKPDKYTDANYVKWLNEIESDIYYNIILPREDSEEIEYEKYADATSNKKLIVGAPYEDIYTYYLMAKVDYFNDEMIKYNNNMSMSNSLKTSFANDYNQKHMIARKTKLKFW